MKTIRIKKIIPFLIIFILTIINNAAYAETFKNAVLKVLENSNELKTAQAKKEAAKQIIRASYGKWHPHFGLNSETQKSETAGAYTKNNEIITEKEANLKIEQLLWDFGNASAEIQTGKHLYAKMEFAFETIRQKLILEALTAYLNLKKAEKALKYSQTSNNSIPYNKAKEKAAGIFKRPAEEISALEPPSIPSDILPESVEEAKQIALKSNPNIMIFYFNVKAAEEKIAAEKANRFLPAISAEAGSTFKRESASKLSGDIDDHYAGLTLNYAANFGGTELNSVKNLRQEYISAVKQYDAKKQQIARLATAAFTNFVNARKKTEFLEKQQNPIGIASAKTDQTIAAYALLEAVGNLNTNTIESSLPNSNKQSASASSTKEAKFRTVESLIDAWAIAWVKKDFDSYILCYDENFIPSQNISRAKWASIRQKRLMAPDFIEIAIDITKKEILSPDTVLITFTQKYKSNLYKDSAIKKLTLKFKNNCWKIVREEAANI